MDYLVTNECVDFLEFKFSLSTTDKWMLWYIKPYVSMFGVAYYQYRN